MSNDEITFGVFVKGCLVNRGTFVSMKDVLRQTPNGVMKRCQPPTPVVPPHYEVIKVQISDLLGEIAMARKKHRGGVRALKAQLRQLQSADWRV